MKYSLNIPNQITLARLVLAIIFFVVLSQYSQRTSPAWKLDVAAAVFIVAAGSDFIDGYLARKWKMVTPLGRVLDPMVDKVLICGAFILFLAPGFVDADGRNVTEMRGWMVVVIVGRELLVTGLRGFNESQGRAFGASLHGKVKMWIQSFAAPTILLMVAHEQSVMSASAATTVKLVIVWLTVLVTALSMLQYLARSRHILEESAAA
ncbi:MAG: CDP-diacylglycerol--glycerol-3-phosphate 3-phosphatidyltransferase [Phycisphaerales bacterium]|nr:CDP-diacylglycerol--glycerol-3-phosphate 3-phosphatidyltransferase [Phycisphaerales bacterium]